MLPMDSHTIQITINTSMQNDICFLTIYDQAHGINAHMLRNSLKHFHPNIPLVEITEKELEGMWKPDIFYKAAPYFANKYIDQYKTIIKLDIDQIIVGSLQDVIDDPLYDVGVVYNYNRMDAEKYGLIKVWDILPQTYLNNGFVVLRSKEFITHWLMLCNRPNFVNYPMREQDILNILCYYGNYRVKLLDEGPNWYGLAAKAEWNTAILREKDIVIPESKTVGKEKTLRVIHFAGGESGIKMNFHSYFTSEVSAYIEELIK